MDIAASKQKLVDSLGADVQAYWSTLKQWYRQKITKSEFDEKARLLLGDSNVRLHNDFILALLAKCQKHQTGQSSRATAVAMTSGSQMSSSPEDWDRSSPITSPKTPVSAERRPRKRLALASSATQIESLFVPVSPMRFVTEVSSHKDYRLARQIPLCSQDLFLPDAPSLYGRLLLCVLDMGLDGIADEVAHFVSQAVEVVLKNLLSSAISHRKTCQLKKGRFQHSFTWNYSRPTLSERRTQSVENEIASILSSNKKWDQTRDSPVSLSELRTALMIDKRLLPATVVYAGNMERLLAKLWHSSRDDVARATLWKNIEGDEQTTVV
ncbi:transcriptional adapter 1-like isoform X2 [Oscarella lobularis]|uniref:transcriptional adapter 1-like isoform X2 n=1 Tax=Oscarella lobularis TaxID=121494 RepID=UPI003314428F